MTTNPVKVAISQTACVAARDASSELLAVGGGSRQGMPIFAYFRNMGASVTCTMGQSAVARGPALWGLVLRRRSLVLLARPLHEVRVQVFAEQEIPTARVSRVVVGNPAPPGCPTLSGFLRFVDIEKPSVGWTEEG